MIRGGILVTGTEVLTGIITDRNGPWLSEEMRSIGVQPAQITIVGDRPGDVEGALEGMATEGLDLVVTSGGLGPTADDLTAESVGRFQGRPMVLDQELEGRIADILARLADRWPDLDLEAVRAANRKQAVIPEGATVLDPVGTAPGLVVPPGDGSGPLVVVLPGPPRELKPMWSAALGTPPLRQLLADLEPFERRIIRIFGIPESELAGALREMETEGTDLSRLEVTTCLRRGEIEIATAFSPADLEAYEGFETAVVDRFGQLIHSLDGRTVDESIPVLLDGRTLAVAESCTGGMLSARLTERPGSSAWFLGGVTAYSNSAKADLVGVDQSLIELHGAVSEEVAIALAEGARARFGSDIGVGVTGIAGPGGGSEEKPVGLVWFAISGESGNLARSVVLPGGRADVRDRSTTVALHLLRRALLGGGARLS